MSNKGYAFEAELTQMFREEFGDLYRACYRVIGSGQSKNATITGGDILEGDVYLELDVNDLPLKLRFLAEAKWYKVKGKTVKSMAIRKDWLDQARHEAEKNQALCLFVFKMKGQNKNSKELKQYSFAGVDANSTWICLPSKHFTDMILEFYKTVKEQKREIVKWQKIAKKRARIIRKLKRQQTK